MTRVYVQMQLEDGDRRGKALVGAYAASPDALRASLEASLAQLGPLTVLPVPAHEFNLKAVLGQDLAAAGHPSLSPAPSEGPSLVLVAKRVPSEAHQGASANGAAEVLALSYEVESLA